MVKIGLHSDLHLELQIAPRDFLKEIPDVMVLAGDICNIRKSAVFLRQLAEFYPNTTWIYVAGNHEFYDSGPISEEEENLREAIADLKNVHFLQCDSIEIKGVRFLGCTAWSRLNLLGDGATKKRVMLRVSDSINDFVYIKNDQGKTFTPSDCAKLGDAHYRWLEQELAKPCDLPTVVVTHFSPGIEFHNHKYKIDEITAYFHNHFSPLIKKHAPEYWLYGHTHCNESKRLYDTEVLSNQRGYGQELIESYDPNFMFEI